MSETVINVTHVHNGNGSNHVNNNNPSNNLGWIQFNIEYFLTRDGILKLVQLVRKYCKYFNCYHKKIEKN
jgi:hypothetical protein